VTGSAFAFVSDVLVKGDVKLFLWSFSDKLKCYLELGFLK